MPRLHPGIVGGREHEEESAGGGDSDDRDDGVADEHVYVRLIMRISSLIAWHA